MKKAGFFPILLCSILLAGCSGGSHEASDHATEATAETSTVTDVKTSVTVHFKCNASTGELDDIPDDQTVQNGETVACPPYPTRAGFVFDGWYSDASCTNAYDFSQEVTSDLTLYAAWLDEDDPEAVLTSEQVEKTLASILEIQQLNSDFFDENHEISQDALSDVLDAVENYVLELQECGDISFYARNTDSIYMEFSWMIPVLYAPSVSGFASGGGDDTTITVVQPFANADRPMNGITSSLTDMLQEALAVSSIVQTYDDSHTQAGGVTFVSLQSLPTSSILLWNGHGGLTWSGGSPVLITSETVDDSFFGDLKEASKLFRMKYDCVSIPDDQNMYVAITPAYVRTYFSLDEGLVYLSACKSGYNDTLADEFLLKGASTVFVNRGSDDIQKWYTQAMMELVIKYMSGYIDKKVYYSAQEALEQAHQALENQFGEEYRRTSYSDCGDGIYIYQDAYPEIVGDQTYTINSGIKGTLTISDEQMDIANVTLQLDDQVLISQADGVSSDSTHLMDGNHFYFNKIDPGTHSLKIYYNGVLCKELSDIEVTSHHFNNLGEISLGLSTVTISVSTEDQSLSENVTVRLMNENGETFFAEFDRTIVTESFYTAAVLPGVWTIEVFADGYETQTETVQVADSISCSYVLNASRWKDLYIELMTCLTEYHAGTQMYEIGDCPVLANRPSELEGVWKDPSGITGFLLTDLNEDGIPELVLEDEQTQDQMFIFTIENNQIVCKGQAMLDRNQEGVCTLSLYRDDQGRPVAVSDVDIGTGAGHQYPVYYTEPETLHCIKANFYKYQDYSNDAGYYMVYQIGESQVTEEEYEKAKDDFYGALTLEDVLTFTPLAADPAVTLSEAMDAIRAD